MLALALPKSYTSMYDQIGENKRSELRHCILLTKGIIIRKEMNRISPLFSQHWTVIILTWTEDCEQSFTPPPLALVPSRNQVGSARQLHWRPHLSIFSHHWRHGRCPIATTVLPWMRFICDEYPERYDELTVTLSPKDKYIGVITSTQKTNETFERFVQWWEKQSPPTSAIIIKPATQT